MNITVTEAALAERTTIALPDEVRTLIESASPAHLATLLPDGAPHSVPLWVGLEDERIAFLTAPGSRKARNVERDPRVSISLTHADNPNAMAQIRGRATERVNGDRAWTIIDRIFLKYIGQPYPERTDRVVFLVTPDRAWGVAF